MRTKAIHFENFLKFTKTHMSVEVKSGVCGLVSADKYKFIALSDYDKIGRFQCVWSRGVCFGAGYRLYLGVRFLC